MSWTQPLCNNCWDEAHPDRMATRLRDAEEVTCCQCGKRTTSGIWTRLDPQWVPFPYSDD